MRSIAFVAMVPVVMACGTPTTSVVASAPRAQSMRFVASYDLPRGDARTSELSGITWDDATHRLYAISDTSPIIVPLIPNEGFTSWTVGEPIALSIGAGADSEGIAATANGFYISTELGSHIYEVDRAGAPLSELRLPAHFGRTLHNRSLESLSLTPDRAFLFTANETALQGDGPQATADAGTTVRILRRELASGSDAEFVYRTDPVFAPGPGGEMGVAEMCALSKDDILVLERSYVPNVGNAIRLYRVRLEGADVSSSETIADAAAPSKELILDFSTIARACISSPTRLPNYEGLALGPTTSGGERLVFVISDDNGLTELVSRVLVLSMRLLP